MSRFSQWMVCAVLGVAVGIACGPFFGIEVLRNRSESVLAPPAISFENELKALAPAPKDKLPVVENDQFDSAPVTRDSLEAKEIPEAALTKVRAMRQQENGDAAYAAGDGVAEGLRHYTAGAVSFAHAQPDQAQVHFQAVLDLPSADKKNRELWARFMLGRIAAAKGDLPAATAQFEAVRQLVRHGAPDPLGVAVASYGEEARGTWKQGLVSETVKLYAQQAAYGSKSGLSSLLLIAGQILKDKDLLDKAMDDPTARQLVFISLNKNSGDPIFVGPEGGDLATIDGIMFALTKHKVTKMPGAGLLAAAAYNQGNFEVAERLTHWEDVPIGFWVRAKLALRRGERETALKNYAKAIKGYEGKGTPSRIIQAEAGVVQVSQEEYAAALELFLKAQGPGAGFADYWGDAAYLAERVMTTDELKSFVDSNVPPDKIPAKKEGGVDTANREEDRPELTPNTRLRAILARRLMREGKRPEALKYFDDPDIRQAAKAYDDSFALAASRWRLPYMRAQAMFQAAKIAREKGMEILGFERDPDWAMWDGDYEPVDAPLASNQKGDAGQWRANPKDPYETQDERKRAAASKAAIAERFQYRYVAAQETEAAADLLPRSSQAYAAVLCEGTSWMLDRDPARAKELYQRYVKQGPHQSWAKTFGHSCPQPNFNPLAVYSVARKIELLKNHMRAHMLMTAGAGAAAIALSGAIFYLMLRRRRRRAEMEIDGI